jgi:hypothetical protein
MLLTPEERNKFATWCEQNAESAQLLCDQLKNLPGPAANALAPGFKMEIAACTFIAQKLRTTEDQTLGR